MYTQSTTPALGTPSETWTAELRERGYCVLRDIVDPAEVAGLAEDLAPSFDAAPFCQGGFYGERTRRFGRLLMRSPRAAPFVLHPLICQIAEEILSPFCDRIQLNLSQAIGLYPGALPQLPHRDQDMWRGAIGEVEYLVNVMWPFTPYRQANGATLLWPGSHGMRALEPEPPSEPVAIEMDPGSALLFLGSTLHGAGGNSTRQVRRGMLVSYCLGWLKPYENQWLAYPPEIARSFEPELAALVGYQQHRPNLGNFEGQCPSVLLRGGPLTGAADALRPDQQALVEAYVAQQRASH